MITIIIIITILISSQTIRACEYSIIWDRDFCNSTEQDRLENSILPPNILDPICEFETGSNITLEHLNSGIYENLYRVYDKYDFSICSATNSSSELLLINTSLSFTLDPTNYVIGEEIYFISTSNGSKFSAENHKKTEQPCLQFAFKVVQMRNACYTCNSTIFDDVNDNFGCQSTMDLLLLIYIGVPLFILLLIGCILVALVFSQNSTRKLILQHSVNRPDVTADTSA